MFQTNFAEKIKGHISLYVSFYRKLCSLRENVEKLRGSGKESYYNTAHSRCVLDK